MDFKSLNFAKIQRFTSAQAAEDLNVFLERLPQNAGQTALIAAGIAWAIGLGLGLYTAVQTKALIEVREELKETKALLPVVPKIRDVPVPQAEVKTFTDTINKLYPGLTVKQQGAAIYITSGSTSAFAQFREAIGHVQNGGQGWRVSVDRLCVGRECEKDHLAALLKINKVSVDKVATGK